jgi:hypothetical protein
MNLFRSEEHIEVLARGKGPGVTLSVTGPRTNPGRSAMRRASRLDGMTVWHAQNEVGHAADGKSEGRPAHDIEAGLRHLIDLGPVAGGLANATALRSLSGADR